MKATLALAALFTLAALAPTAGAADKPAAKGVKCGSSYIAAGKTCTKTTATAKAATPAMSKPAAPAAKSMAAAKPAGKKCGNGYIAATAVCHK